METVDSHLKQDNVWKSNPLQSRDIVSKTRSVPSNSNSDKLIVTEFYLQFISSRENNVADNMYIAPK